MTFQSPGLTRSMAYLAEAYSLTLGPLLPFLLYAPVLLAARKLGRRPPAGAAPGSQPAARVPRNAPCPCGSGKKHKRCCGR